MEEWTVNNILTTKFGGYSLSGSTTVLEVDYVFSFSPFLL